MSLTVIINGANGRMGKATQTAINEAEDLELIGTCGHDDDLAEQIAKLNPEIVIDFTIAGYGFENAKTIIAGNAHPVIGTSGFSEAEIGTLNEMCSEKNWGAIIAPNFSVGAVLMMQFAKQAARYFEQAEIIERHHQYKVDAPSGTAIHTAELIAEGRSEAWERIASAESIEHSRGGNLHGVGIHSLRLPGSLAHQEVLFGSDGETLTLKHDSTDRAGFMPGVLLACRAVKQQTGLVYGLEHLLLNN